MFIGESASYHKESFSRLLAINNQVRDFPQVHLSFRAFIYNTWIAWNGRQRLRDFLLLLFANYLFNDFVSSNRELLSHENVTFNNNGTLSTIPHHPLEWRGELSEGRSEDDILYLPNIALLVSEWITHPAWWIRRISKEFFSEKTPERWNRTREM